MENSLKPHLERVRDELIHTEFIISELKEDKNGNTSKYVNHLKAKATILCSVIAYSRAKQHISVYGKRYLGKNPINLIFVGDYKEMPEFLEKLASQDLGFDIGYFNHLLSSDLITSIDTILAEDPLVYRDNLRKRFMSLKSEETVSVGVK